MSRPSPSLDLLSSVLKSTAVSADQAGSGGNSKVYKVRCQDGAEYVVKFYIQHTSAGLDRLEVEFSALAFMWEGGIRCIPRPLMADRATRAAVYEFVDGCEIDSRSVTPDDVEQVVRFASELSSLGLRVPDRKLPPASEAFFSVDSIIGNIESRLRCLSDLPQQGPTYDAMFRFLASDFVPALATLKRWVVQRWGRDACSRELAPTARTLSPSDLGFHNAVMRPSGELVFLDFEYFGWDDPAKMIADFVLHPAMELSAAIKGIFVRRILDCFSADPLLPARLEALYPLFGLKWCMIMLNEFIPKDLARREFAAHASVDAVVAQIRQLDKSKAMLQKIMGEFESFPYMAQIA